MLARGNYEVGRAGVESVPGPDPRSAINLRPARFYCRYAKLFTFLAILLLISDRLPAADFGAALAEGDARARRLDEAGAVAAYERAHRLDPPNFEAWERLTLACLDLGNALSRRHSSDTDRVMRKAVGLAEEMRRQFPERAEPCFLLAASYGSLSLYKGGREKLELGRNVEEYARKSLQLDPNYALPYAVLGVFYREVASLNWAEKTVARHLLGGLPSGSYQDSENMLLRAVELAPDSLYARYQLAATYESEGKRKEALEAWRAAAELSPRNTQELAFKQNAQDRLRKLGWGAPTIPVNRLRPNASARISS